MGQSQDRHHFGTVCALKKRRQLQVPSTGSAGRVTNHRSVVRIELEINTPHDIPSLQPCHETELLFFLQGLRFSCPINNMSRSYACHSPKILLLKSRERVRNREGASGSAMLEY